jgi:hypothetical protein
MTAAPQPVWLDFVAPIHRAPVAGVALGALGLAAVLALGATFHATLRERARLDQELEATARPRHVAPAPETLKLATDAANVERELGIPWTRLLAELEAASRDSASTVSVLQIQPDPGGRRVRITAEVRAMDDALGYLKRLEGIDILRHPMLESHERRKDDPEHPLRIQLSAEWRP